METTVSAKVVGKVVGTNPQPVLLPSTPLSLHLVLYSKLRVLRGQDHVSYDSGIINTSEMRRTSFPVSHLEEPEKMRQVLSRALGRVVDVGSLDQLAADLLAGVTRKHWQHILAGVDIIRDIKLLGHEEESVEENDLGKCSVCLEDLCGNQKLFRMPCSHRYHMSCIMSWLESEDNNSCPLCRTQICYFS